MSVCERTNSACLRSETSQSGEPTVSEGDVPMHSAVYRRRRKKMLHLAQQQMSDLRSLRGR